MRRNVFARAGLKAVATASMAAQKLANDPALANMANRGRAEIAAAMFHQSPAFRGDMGQMNPPRRGRSMS